MDKHEPNSPKYPHHQLQRNNEEFFRQNGDFAEKILPNLGISQPDSDDYDIRKITRKRVEGMLYAEKLQPNEPAPVSVHLGQKGINQWIWEHLVPEKVPIPVCQTFLQRRLKNTTRLFFYRYKQVLTLTQNISHFHDVPIAQLKDEHILNKECMDFLKKTYTNSKSNYTFLQSIVKHAQTVYPGLPDLPTVSWSMRTKKELHPKVLDYLRYLDKKGISKETKQLKIYQLNLLLQWLCNQMNDFAVYKPSTIPLLRIKDMHLQQFKAYLLKQLRHGKYSTLTVDECIHGIKGFFFYLKKHYGFPDPSRRLKSIPAPRYRPRRLPTDNQIKHFFQVIEIYSDTPLLESVAFRLMLQLGFRSNEVVQVTWNDINLSTKTISVHSKGGKEHQLPLVGILLQQLQELKEQQGSAKFLFGENKTKTKNDLLNHYHLYALIAGWDFPGGLHLFRHLFITRLSKTNPLPQLLKKVTRVVNLDTVSLYQHLSQENKLLISEINKLSYAISKEDL